MNGKSATDAPEDERENRIGAGDAPYRARQRRDTPRDDGEALNDCECEQKNAEPNCPDHADGISIAGGPRSTPLAIK